MLSVDGELDMRTSPLLEACLRAQLHLAGLVTRAVARPLEVTGLLKQFDTYLSQIDALTSLTKSTEVTIRSEQVALLSVSGPLLDDTGLPQLRMQLQVLFDAGTQHLVLNPAEVTNCNHQLFDILARTHQIRTDRQGWMRLVGVGPTIRNALDEATASECLLVHQASDWTGDLAG